MGEGPRDKMGRKFRVLDSKPLVKRGTFDAKIIKGGRQIINILKKKEILLY